MKIELNTNYSSNTGCVYSVLHKSFSKENNEFGYYALGEQYMYFNEQGKSSCGTIQLEQMKVV